MKIRVVFILWDFKEERNFHCPSCYKIIVDYVFEDRQKDRWRTSERLVSRSSPDVREWYTNHKDQLWFSLNFFPWIFYPTLLYRNLTKMGKIKEKRYLKKDIKVTS